MIVYYAFQIGEKIDINQSCIKYKEFKSFIRREELIRLISLDVCEEIEEPIEIRVLNKNIDCFVLLEEDVIYFEQYGINNSIFIIIKLNEANEKVISENEDLDKVEISMNKLNNKLLKNTNSFPEIDENISSSNGQNNVNSFKNINISFLYFNSLSFNEDSNQSINYIVDFEPEMLKLSKFFGNLNKKIRVTFEIANQSNFTQILKQRPCILFISCIGLFRMKDNKPEFFISLEDDHGHLNLISLDCFKILANNNTVDLIIISTNYSKAVLDFFYLAGFPNIICIYSKYHCLDKAGTVFFKNLIKYLLDGYSISDSFEFSKKIVSKKEKMYKEYIPCCCNHEYIKNSNKHCNLMKRLTEYDKYYFCLIHNIKEKGNDKKYHCTCNYKDFKHTLEEKFTIRMKDNLILFRYIEEGKPEISNIKFGEKPNISLNLKNNILIGRNEKIIDICNMILSNLQNRIYNLIGNRGTGKKTLMKMVGKLIILRSKFKNIVNIESNVLFSYLTIKNCFKNQLKIDFEKEDELFRIISDMNIIIIIVLNKFNKNEFIDKFIDEFCKKTKSPIMFIVSDTNGNYDQNLTKNIYLENLHINDSKILFDIVNNFLNSKLNYQDIFNKIDDSCIKNPQFIYLLALFASDKTINRNSLSLGISYVEEKLYGRYIYDTDYLEILYLLIICPNGIFVDNIQKIMIKNMNEKINDLVCKHLVVKKRYDLKLKKKIIFLSDYSEKTVNLINMYISEGMKHKIICQLYTFYRKYYRNILLLKKFEINSENEFENKNYGFWLSLKVINEKVKKDITSSPYHNFKLIKENSSEKIKSTNKKLHKSLGKIPYITAFPNDITNIEKQSNSQNSSDNNFKSDITKESDLYEHINSTPMKNNKNILISNFHQDSFLKIENRYPLFEEINPNYSKEEFFFQLNNIIKILNIDFIRENFDQDTINNIKDDLEDLSITIPILLKIFKEYEECVNMIMKLMFICMCEEYDLILCRGRILLYFVENFDILNKFKFRIVLQNEEEGQYFSKEENSMILTNIDNEEDILPFIITILEYIYKNEFKKFYEGQAEVLMVKTIRFLEENIIIGEETNIQRIFTDLQECYEKYDACDDTIGKAKVEYIQASIEILRRNYNENVLEKLNHSKQLFHLEKLYILSLKCLCRIIDWFFGINNLIQSRIFLLEAKDYMKDFIDKKQNYKIFEQINIEINYLDIIILQKLRKNNDHVINFMKAHQLIRKQKETYVIVEPIIQYVSNFKAKMIENFQDVEKKLSMNFDILNEDNLENVFKNGSRILHISNEVYDNSESLFVEDKLGFTQEISPSKLIGLINKYGPLFDLIILAFPQSKGLGELLIRNGIPHVICFHFKKEFLKLNSDYPIFSISNIFQKFTKKLLKNLIKKEKTLKESYEKAKKKFYESIKNVTDKYVNFNIKIDLLKFASSELLSRDINQDRLYNFEEGKLKDISKKRTKNKININKRDFHLIGRKRELSECLEILNKNQDVIIYGKSGVGKTCFVKELGYFLNMRSYFITGIYYYDLSEIATYEEFLKIKININLEDHIANLKPCSIKNGILIILDNCDRIFKNDKKNISNFIAQYKNKNEKSVNFVFSFKHLSTKIKNSEIIKLKKLNLKESVMMFLLNLKKKLTRGEILNKKTSEDDNIIELLYKNKNIKHCVGFPKEIKKLAHICNNKRLKDIQINEFSHKSFKHSIKDSSKLSLTLTKKKLFNNKNSNTALNNLTKKSKEGKKHSEKNLIFVNKKSNAQSLRYNKRGDSRSPIKLINKLKKIMQNNETKSPFTKGSEGEEEDSDNSPDEFEDQCEDILKEKMKVSSIGSNDCSYEINEFQLENNNIEEDKLNNIKSYSHNLRKRMSNNQEY